MTQLIEVRYVINETIVTDIFHATASSVSKFLPNGRTITFTDGVDNATDLKVISVMYESAPRIIRYQVD